MKRDGSTEEAASQRIRSQMPLSDKVDRADIVIDNSSDRSQLEKQVKNLIERVRPSTLTWALEYAGPAVAVAALAVAIKKYLPKALLFLGDKIASLQAS